MKYSRIFIPSRKLDLIGISMVLPLVANIEPRIAASCLICLVEPRAPESAMILIGLRSWKHAIILAVTSSVVFAQILITLL